MSAGDGSAPPRRVEELSREAVFQGYCRIDRYRLRHSLHGGGMGAPLSREVLERGHAAAVLPVDVRADRVLLIEQFRPGAHAAGWQPWLLECVAGIIEPGESSAAVARRETVEEAGCTLGRIEPIGRFLSSPGASSETVALYVGEVDSRAAGGVHGLAAEGEDIRVHVLGVGEAIAMLDRGDIVNAKTVVALHWLARHYAGLKGRWSRA